jgi:hypothetical protein
LRLAAPFMRAQRQRTTKNIRFAGVTKQYMMPSPTLLAHQLPRTHDVPLPRGTYDDEASGHGCKYCVVCVYVCMYVCVVCVYVCMYV